MFNELLFYALYLSLLPAKWSPFELYGVLKFLSLTTVVAQKQMQRRILTTFYVEKSDCPFIPLARCWLDRIPRMSNFLIDQVCSKHTYWFILALEVRVIVEPSTKKAEVFEVRGSAELWRSAKTHGIAWHRMASKASSCKRPRGTDLGKHGNWVELESTDHRVATFPTPAWHRRVTFSGPAFQAVKFWIDGLFQHGLAPQGMPSSMAHKQLWGRQRIGSGLAALWRLVEKVQTIVVNCRLAVSNVSKASLLHVWVCCVFAFACPFENI